MRVDIKPQWRKLVKWYWDSCEGKDVQDSGMSIWEMLEKNYSAKKLHDSSLIVGTSGLWVEFPDEKMYTIFLLRWS